MAECLKEPKCVAMTYSARPKDPCELYTSITTKQNGDPTGLCHGFVKCAAASASAGAAACAHFSAPAPGPFYFDNVTCHDSGIGTEDDRLRMYWADGQTSNLICSEEGKGVWACG